MNQNINLMENSELQQDQQQQQQQQVQGQENQQQNQLFNMLQQPVDNNNNTTNVRANSQNRSSRSRSRSRDKEQVKSTPVQFDKQNNNQNENEQQQQSQQQNDQQLNQIGQSIQMQMNNEQQENKNEDNQEPQNLETNNNNYNQGVYVQDGIKCYPPNLQHQYRHARRLYVGNIPDNISEQYLIEWLYRSMEAADGLLEEGNPIRKVDIQNDQKYAFVELRSIEETTAMEQLDGMILWNRALRIRRPTEYEHHERVNGTRQVPKLNLNILESIGILIIPTRVAQGENKIFLSNLPKQCDEYTIIENLKLRKHGDLKAFHLVKDNGSSDNKGYCFFEYKDPSKTQNVINALNQALFFERKLICKRACQSDNEMDNKKQMNNKKGGQNRKENYNQKNNNGNNQNKRNYQNNNNNNNQGNNNNMEQYQFSSNNQNE